MKFATTSPEPSSNRFASAALHRFGSAALPRFASAALAMAIGLLLFCSGCPEAVEPIDRDLHNDRDWSSGDPASDAGEEDQIPPPDASADPSDAGIDVPVDPLPTDTASDPAPDGAVDLADTVADTPSDQPDGPVADSDLAADLDPDPDLDAELSDLPIDPVDTLDLAVDATDLVADRTDTTDPTDLPSGGTVLITEICDHATQPAARYIEIFNATGYAVSLDGWEIELWDHYGADPAVYTFPDTVLYNGATFVVAKTQIAFEAAFPERYADDYSGVIDGTGNDAYVLTNGYSDIDVYGEAGVDGTSQPWYYSDRVAKRAIPVIDGQTVWQQAEWTITPGVEDADPGDRE